MSKVFRRPMFRKGGGANMNGIMSGIQDRQNYAVGTQDVEAAEFGFGQMSQGARSAGELGYDFDFAVPTFKTGPGKSIGDIRSEYEKELLAAAGDRSGFDPLTTFLLQYGPQVATQTGGGSTLANIVGAAKKPLESMLKEKKSEDEFLRSIKTRAAGAAIEAKEAQEAQAMELQNKLATAEADIINKSKELKNQITLNKELSKVEKDNLLTQLAANRQLALEKIDLQSKNAEKLLRMELDADETTDFKTYLEEYKGSTVQAKNRADFENKGLEAIANEQFGESYEGFIGGVHGRLKDYEKKNNIGKIYYDVTDGVFKRLRKTEDGYEYEKLDVATFDPEADKAKKVPKEKFPGERSETPGYRRPPKKFDFSIFEKDAFDPNDPQA